MKRKDEEKLQACDCGHDYECDCDHECDCGHDHECDCGHDHACDCDHDHECEMDCTDCEGCRCEDCEEEDCTDCECEECEGCEHSHGAVLVIDARRGLTVKGLLGALADLGALDEEMAADVASRFAGDVGITFYDAVAKGCKGIEVELSEGVPLTDDEFDAAIEKLTEGYVDGDNFASTLFGGMYDCIIDAVAAEQGGEATDLGSFERSDMMYALALCAEAFANVVANVTVTTVELGHGDAIDNGVAVERPTSLTAAMLSEAEIAVSVTEGAVGVDTPSAAVLAAVSEAQTDDVSGDLIAKGFGIDGEVVTRLYVFEV